MILWFMFNIPLMTGGEDTKQALFKGDEAKLMKGNGLLTDFSKLA